MSAWLELDLGRERAVKASRRRSSTRSDEQADPTTNAGSAGLMSSRLQPTIPPVPIPPPPTKTESPAPTSGRRAGGNNNPPINSTTADPVGAVPAPSSSSSFQPNGVPLMANRIAAASNVVLIPAQSPRQLVEPMGTTQIFAPSRMKGDRSYLTTEAQSILYEMSNPIRAGPSVPYNPVTAELHRCAENLETNPDSLDYFLRGYGDSGVRNCPQHHKSLPTNQQSSMRQIGGHTPASPEAQQAQMLLTQTQWVREKK